MFLLFHDPTIQEHPVEYSQHVIRDAVTVKFKKYQADATSFLSFVTSPFAHRCLQFLFRDGIL